MTSTRKYHRLADRGAVPSAEAGGFTLIELMTVIFIIGLLIGILIPSLTAARNAAKKTGTAAAIKALTSGLEAFRNDNGKDFRQTNGYPPSFAHPPIGETFQPHLGEFPFLEASEGNPPVVYGAHWLPAMLMGVDALGVVPRGVVPPGLRYQPWDWYGSDPLGNGPLERASLYVDPTGLRTSRTKDLPGQRNDDFFPDPDWQLVQNMPVIVDAFDQPILYYASNAYGTTRNLLEAERNEQNNYLGSPPFYFHQDNEGFTGGGSGGGSGGMGAVAQGWDFGGGEHPIARPGENLTALDLAGEGDTDYRETFAYYIHDAKARQAISDLTVASPPLQSVNPKTFLLISAGRDARYGTLDDVTNFPVLED